MRTRTVLTDPGAGASPSQSVQSGPSLEQVQVPPAVAALTPDRSVSLGELPGWVAQVRGVTADARRVYVTVYFSDPSNEHRSPGPGELVVLDRATMDVATAVRIPVGWQPRKVVVDSQHQRLYVLNYGQQSYSVMVFDSRTLRPVGEGELKLGQGGTDLVADAHLGRAYVANSYQRRIHVIDGLAGTVLDPMLLPVAFAEIGPHGIGFDEALGLVLATRGLYSGPSAPIDEVLAFDPQVPNLVRSLRLDAQARPTDVAFDPVSRRVYVGRAGAAGQADSGLSVVEDVSPFQNKTPFVSQQVKFSGAATVEVDRFLGLVHVAGGRHLRMLDSLTDTVVAEFDFGAGLPVHGLAVAPDSAVYVGASGSQAAWLWQFTPPGRPRPQPAAPFGAPVAAAATGEHEMVVFVAGSDGGVYAASWADDGNDWSQWNPLGGAFPLRAPLAACSKGGGRWQLVGVDDRGVLVTLGGHGPTPEGSWVDLHDASRSFPAGTPVTMISRAAGHWLAFAVDAAGEVFSVGASDAHPEPTSQVVPGPGFEPGTSLVAVTRKSDHWDLFALRDGQVWTTWWSVEDGFNGWGMAGSGPFPGGFPPGTPLAAVGRKSTQLDVFAVGPDGAVKTLYWNSSEGWSAWGSIGGDFPPGTRLAATGRTPDALDLLGVGTFGLYTTFWHKEDGWAPWVRLGAAPWTRNGTPVIGINRHRRQIDAFWAHTDGSIRTAWWNPAQGRWSSQADIERRIPTQMRRHTAPISTDTSLSGDVVMDIWTDGSYLLRGHMHNSRWDPYDYSVLTTLRSNSRTSDAISHQAGHVDGTGSEPWPGGDPDRDDFWSDMGISPPIALNFADFEAGELVTDPQYKNSGLGGFWDNLGPMLLDVVANTMVPGRMFAGFPLLSRGVDALLRQIVPGDDERAGLFIKYGTAFLMSPGGLFPLLVADALIGEVLEELIGYREMREEEKVFARRVFGDSLDDILHRVRLTNLRNFEGNPVVVPLLNLRGGEDLITVNMGRHYEKPLEGEHRKELIHELVHVWQIRYSLFTPRWALCTLLDRTYAYPQDGRRWSGYGHEQQGELVEEWFADHIDEPDGGLDGPAAKADPRFRYIVHNLRLGRR